ncbi:MAG: AAA family ATPase [Myxococcota bacterium]|nr:AAA family ATPase [Myxococcota bacterium]
MDTSKTEPGYAYFVGRRAEVDFFYNCMRAAVHQREAQVVTLNGPAGIGKTRLLTELIARLEARGRPVRIYRVDLALRDGPPVLQQIVWSRFNLSADESPEIQLDKIRSGLSAIIGHERLADAQRFVATVAGVTTDTDGLPFAGMATELITNPQFLIRARKTVLNLIRFDASSTPHLWVLEDWDRTESEVDTAVLKELMERLDSRMACILISTRTEISLPHLRVSHFNLEPLSLVQTCELLRGCVENVEELPDGFVEDTAKQCAGNPRLALELVRLFRSKNVLKVDETGEWRFRHEDYAPQSVPSDIHTTVRQRYAELSDDERSLLQRIKRFGDVAWVNGVVSVSRALSNATPPTEAGDDLRRTVVASIDSLIDQGHLELAEDHLFRGVRSVRFSSQELMSNLPQATSEVIELEHSVIAQWLMSRTARDPARARRMAITHWLAAGRPERAVDLVSSWLSNASGADLDDAMTASDTVLAGLGPADAEAKITLLRSAARRSLVTQRPGGAAKLLDRLAHEVAVLDDENGHASTLMMRGECELIAGRLDRAIAYLDRSRLTWETLGNRSGRADTLERKAAVLAYRGGADALDSAIKMLERVIALRRDLGHTDTLASTLVRIGEFQVQSGHLQKARKVLQESLDLTTDSAPLIRARAYAALAELDWEAGEPSKAESSWDKAHYLAHEWGDVVGVARVRLSKAEPLVAARRSTEAREEAEAISNLANELGRRDLQARATALLSNAALADGHEEEARSYANLALSHAEGVGRQLEVARALFARARVGANALFITPSDENETMDSTANDFQTAVTILDEMGERPLLTKVLQAYGQYLSENGSEVMGRRQSTRARELRLTLRSDAAEQRAFHAAQTIRRTYQTSPVVLDDIETAADTAS